MIWFLCRSDIEQSETTLNNHHEPETNKYPTNKYSTSRSIFRPPMRHLGTNVRPQVRQKGPFLCLNIKIPVHYRPIVHF